MTPELVTAIGTFVPLLETCLWVAVLLALTFKFRGQLGGVVDAIKGRVDRGGGFKTPIFEMDNFVPALQSVEGEEGVSAGGNGVEKRRALEATDNAKRLVIDGNYVGDEAEEDAGLESISSAFTPSESRPSLPAWTNQRDSIYDAQRGVFLVHSVTPSKEPGQRFDVHIYLMAHGAKRPFGTEYEQISHAEYYLGRFWGHRVFHRANQGGPIGLKTAAYGTFLCICRVVFTDGEEVVINRYVDFEMGKAFMQFVGDSGPR